MKKILILIFCLSLLFGRLPTLAAPTQADLEQELKQIQDQITQYEKQLTTTVGQKLTLAAKIKQLKSKQAQLRLQIKSTTLLIKDLDKKLTATEIAIQKTITKKRQLTVILGSILRQLNQKDNEILLESLSQDNGLAGAFVDIQNYLKISDGLKELVDQKKQVAAKLTTLNAEYSNQQDDAEQLLAVKKIQEGTLVGSLGEQQDLLATTQGQEKEYQKLLADKKKQATEIRSRIYELFGGAKQINFGEAVNIADWVSKQTGVRTPFLLAILTQESNLGKNVGTCNRPNDPPEKGWRVIMKPNRDQEPFKTITNNLGLDIDTTPVSCPMKDKNGKQYGWGGAMGPAQFIPSTWLGYQGKVSAITGAPANPWDIRDAFIAAAVKLKNDGANGTSDGEWAASMRYFSGSTNTKYRFYGDNVLKLAAKYVEDIKTLNQ